MLIIDIKANIYAKYVHETISIEMEIIMNNDEDGIVFLKREDVK